MTDARMRRLERLAAAGVADPDELAAARSRWRLCCRGTGWSAPWERCGCGLPPSVEEWGSWLPPEVERIDDLLPESLIAEQRERWLRIGLATGPTDRPLAEAGIRAAYAAAGLAPPEQWIWLESPLRGAVAVAQLTQVRAQVGAQVCDQVGAQVRAKVWSQVCDQVCDQARAQVCDQVWAPVWAQVRAPVGTQVCDQVWAQVRAQVWRACYGSHDAHWLGYYETFLRGGLPAARRLRGLVWAAMACGWWWPFERAVIVTERPSVIEWDGGRVRRIVYPDGWEVNS